MVFLDEHVHELDPLHVPPANAIVGPAGTSAGAHTAKRAIAALIVATIVGGAILLLTRGQSDTAAVVGQSPSPAVDVTPKLTQAAPTLIPTPSASAVRDEMNPALVYGDCDAALRPFANALLGFAMWIGQTHTKAEYNTRLAALEPVYRAMSAKIGTAMTSDWVRDCLKVATRAEDAFNDFTNASKINWNDDAAMLQSLWNAGGNIAFSLELALINGGTLTPSP